MSAQTYKVLQFEKGDFVDDHGNYWCSMQLQGVGEPVRIVVKDPTQFSTGMELYGSTYEATSKAGKTYLRFKREQKPEQSYAPKAKGEWQPRDDSAIRAQWAISQSIQIGMTNNGLELEEIKKRAKELFDMVDVVKAPALDEPATDQGGF